MVTWTPLPSSGGASSSGATPTPWQAPDLLTGLISARGSVIDFSDFEGGSLNGWAPNMWDWRTPLVPITTVTYPVASGSHALAMVLADRPYAARASDSKPVMGGTTTAVKRLVNYLPSGYKSISALVAIASGGCVDDPAWGSWGIGFDIQRIDNSTRGFFKAQCVFVEPDGTNLYGSTKWQICKDDGSFIDVPGSTFALTGENENKQGWNYVRLTISDSGTGSYVELQVNGKVFDLRSLGAGRGSQAPQMGDGSGTDDGWMLDYRGGWNPIVFANQRTVGSAAATWPNNADTAVIAFDRILVTMGDTPA